MVVDAQGGFCHAKDVAEAKLVEESGGGPGGFEDLVDVFGALDDVEIFGEEGDS